MEAISNTRIGKLSLKNPILRSATFEGMANEEGFPTDEYLTFYDNLARGGMGGIITGFTYINQTGRAMHPGQAGMDHPDKIPFFRKLGDRIHEYDIPVFVQLAHTGRQSRHEMTEAQLVAPSGKRSWYFRERPRPLAVEEIRQIINQFAESALYAQKAGLDGIQLHAAHGYLIHQFLIPSINTRRDAFGINPETKLGTLFLEKIIDAVRAACSKDFPILVKISGGDDLKPKTTTEQFIELIRFLDRKAVDAIEISYGTMDYAMNIFRGDLPLERLFQYNPIFSQTSRWKLKIWKNTMFPGIKRKFKPFLPAYNLPYARLAKDYTDIPIISVGGFRSGDEIFQAIEKGDADMVGLSRPLICEPDFVQKIIKNKHYHSRCMNCNCCAIMCDSPNVTMCYQ